MFRSRLVLVLVFAAMSSLVGCVTTSKASHVAPPSPTEKEEAQQPPAAEPVRKTHVAQAPKPTLRPTEPPTATEPPAPPAATASEYRCGDKGSLERRPLTERPSGVMAYEPGMTRPEKLSGPVPMYTQEALDAGVQGQLIARCILSREGQVRSCRILKPLPPLEEAVLRALCASRYSPVLKEGQPVDAEYTFNVRLSLP